MHVRIEILVLSIFFHCRHYSEWSSSFSVHSVARNQDSRLNCHLKNCGRKIYSACISKSNIFTATVVLFDTFKEC